jgi:hypothetical protein
MMRISSSDGLIVRLLRWVVLLLVIGALWIGFLRLMLVIPTPAHVDEEHTYFSPLPATLFVHFFRLNAPLLGWQPGWEASKYRMSFSNSGAFNGPIEGCESASVMDLEIAPGSVWGSFVHWEVRQMTICGHLDS